MKAVPFKYLILFLWVPAFFIFTQSCVSKKKFVIVTEQFTTAERRMNVLKEENEILRADFQNYKNEKEQELLQKHYLIDSLRRTVTSLNSDITSRKDNIEEQFFAYQVETARLTKQIGDKDNEIRLLTREISALKVQVEDLTREREDAKSGFKLPFGNIKQLERKIQAKDKEISFLDSCLTTAREEIRSLKQKVNQLDTLKAAGDSSVIILDQTE